MPTRGVKDFVSAIRCFRGSINREREAGFFTFSLITKQNHQKHQISNLYCDIAIRTREVPYVRYQYVLVDKSDRKKSNPPSTEK